MSTSPSPALKDFIRIFIFPLIINKIFMLYFGLNYTKYPGEGYGYGLLGTILFLAYTIGRFLWKYRNEQDP